LGGWQLTTGGFNAGATGGTSKRRLHTEQTTLVLTISSRTSKTDLQTGQPKRIAIGKTS
jgi:hypothetical protein